MAPGMIPKPGAENENLGKKNQISDAWEPIGALKEVTSSDPAWQTGLIEVQTQCGVHQKLWVAWVLLC